MSDRSKSRGRLAKGAKWLVATTAVTIALGALASSSLASGLHLLAVSTTSFSSDGARYVAWQRTPASPVVIFDTRTGQRRAVPEPGCVLVEGERTGTTAAGGGFLLSCFKNPGDDCFVSTYRAGLNHCGELPSEEPPTDAQREARAQVQRLLDAQTATSIQLPDIEPGYWRRVGTRYVEGDASGCVPATRNCSAFYEIATGVVSEQARPFLEPTGQLERSDLDLLGAPAEPAVCPSLHRRVVSRLSHESLGEDLAYDRDVFVHRTRDLHNVRVERCNGRSTFLPGPSEPMPQRFLSSEPRSFELGAGLLTWDNAQNGLSFSPEESASRGTLSCYRLANGRRRTWKLPRLSLAGGFEAETPGVYGYSTHTANFIFWIAVRSVYAVREGFLLKTSSIYAAPLR